MFCEPVFLSDDRDAQRVGMCDFSEYVLVWNVLVYRFRHTHEVEFIWYRLHTIHWVDVRMYARSLSRIESHVFPHVLPPSDNVLCKDWRKYGNCGPG